MAGATVDFEMEEVVRLDEVVETVVDTVVFGGHVGSSISQGSSSVSVRSSQ